jgi:sulfur carrier protein
MVTCEVIGGETHEIAGTPTAAEVLRAVGYNPHEATVLANGRPVPDDGAIEVDRVQVLRLVTGG